MPPANLNAILTFEDLRQQTAIWAGFPERWWVAGGWAIDLAIGSVTRTHDDIDVAILRRDVTAVREQLRAWDLRIVHDGELREWDGAALAHDEHQIWARLDAGTKPVDVADFAADPTFFEVLIEEQDAGRWVYRRSAAVHRPLQQFGRDRHGIPFVAPDIQLLFKSKPHPMYDAKNDGDFELCRPRLTGKEQRWLRDSLILVSPGHRWLDKLG